MNKTGIFVKDMHCRSCEVLIEDELMKVRGVSKVEVDHRSGTATIHSKNSNPDMGEIEKAINDAGYSLGKDEKPLFSKNFRDYRDIFISLIIFLAVVFVFNELGLLKLNLTSSGNYSSLPVVFLVGITAGLSTCLALVGGLVLGSSARFAEKHPDATSLEKFKPHLFFNLGRVAAFFILGGIIGLAGSVFQLSGITLGIMTIAVGMVMVVLGLQLTGISPRLSNISFTLPKGISRFLGVKSRTETEYSHINSMLMGALTFFLPCGFTQAMQLYAVSSGNFMVGALTMGIFAIGTMPGLLGIGGFTSTIKGSLSQTFFRFAGVVVIVLAMFNISNGYNLTGLNLFNPATSRASTQADDPNVRMENGAQVVRMTQVTAGYEPNKFTIKKGIPVKWIINSQDPGSCAASILSAKLGIRSQLKSGENIFEFTPKETGIINFSCMMGMYRGQFNVIDSTATDGSGSNGNTAAQSNNAGQSVPAQTTGGCGCGGGAQTQPQTAPQSATPDSQNSDTQVIKAIYTSNTDIQPNNFQVKVGVPVRFEIDAQDNGSGCMASVTVPGLTSEVKTLVKGETITFNFTPQTTGSYNIACPMGSLRGTITVQ